MFDLAEPPKLIVPPKPAIIRPCGRMLTPAEQRGIGYACERVLTPADERRIRARQAMFMPMLPGSSVSKTLLYLATRTSTTSGTTHTFSSVSLGAADPTRRIVVIIGWENGPTRSVSSVSIDGTNGTIIIGTGATGFGTEAAHRAVASNTSGTISVTFSGSVDRCSISVYALYNFVNSTPTDHGNAYFNADSFVTVSNFDFTSIADKTGVMGGCIYCASGGTFRLVYWSSAYRFFSPGGSFSDATVTRVAGNNVTWPNSMTEAVDGQSLGAIGSGNNLTAAAFVSWI